MGDSARFLGRKYGLSAQEMNRLLYNEGYLEGEPGDYSVTEKGKPFAHETSYRYGPGGTSMRYNGGYDIRTWDPSINDVLNVTPEMKQQAKDDVALRRRQQKEERENYYASMENIQQPICECDEGNDTQPNLDDLYGYAAGAILSAMGVYYIWKKTSPCIKKWWKEKVLSKFEQKNATKSDDTTLETDESI